MKILKRVDLGIVKFGVFKGKKWSDLNKHYLEYVISIDCNTKQENKEIAKQELNQRTFLDGQIELF